MQRLHRPIRVPPARRQAVKLADLGRRDRAATHLIAPPVRHQYVCARTSKWQPTPFMARIVMKFGGTSVADLDRIRNVAKRVKREIEHGNQIAVVVSAMSGVTNQLVKWCTELAPLHDAREYDAVVATGEQVTSGLLAICLQ